MNLKSIFSKAVGTQSRLPPSVLFLPGVSMIGLGCLVWLARDFFVFLIASVLVALGLIMLVMAWRMRPPPDRIRVIETDDLS